MIIVKFMLLINLINDNSRNYDNNIVMIMIIIVDNDDYY